MREIARHRAGKVFLAVLALSIVGMLAAPALFQEPILFLGWMPLPFVVGVAFVLVWLVAYIIYFFGFWPFRK